MKNKIIWITGATSGIGEELAVQLSREGAQLVLSARRVNELERVKQRCEGKVYCLPLDLMQAETFESKVKAVEEYYGRIDMLINNGGISQRSLVSETPLALDRKIMEVNYFGNIALSKAVLPVFQKQKSGRFVVVSSLSGKFGFFLRSAYAASKHALVGFYESLRLEEEKNGVKVSLVFPGLIQTNISQNALSKDGKAHGALDNNQAKGISAEKCAQQIIKGIKKDQLEIFAGAGELKAVTIKRLFPKLFHKIIKKQSAT
ncbi:MAG: SDR family oxidoreductase [Flavobacteriales bacterium]|jgi:short-subunit dehydrogenase|nr:SDR family oxidoreductase [Flavobacteriales bacterium]